MTGEEALEALAAALEAKAEKRGDMTTRDRSLAAICRMAAKPGGYQESARPEPPRQLEIPPEYPRLRVRYDRETGRALEYAVIEDIRSEIPFMSGWYRRPMGELSQLQQEQVRRAE